MKNIFRSFLLLSSFFLISCEKEAINVKVPQVDPKLVVQSFISPHDTLLVVYVTKGLL